MRSAQRSSTSDSGWWPTMFIGCSLPKLYGRCGVDFDRAYGLAYHKVGTVQRLKSSAIVATLLLFTLQGCSNKARCEEPCNKLYNEENCDFASEFGDLQQLRMNRCMDECVQALGGDNTAAPLGIDDDSSSCEKENGEIGACSLSASHVDAWMSCIAEHSCEELDSGSCSPIW